MSNGSIRGWRVLACGVLAGWWPVVAAAQTGAGAVTGFVGDESGLSLAGAEVIATHLPTNAAYVAIANAAGHYETGPIPIGRYSVMVQRQGFRTASLKSLAVEAKQVVRLDFRLQLGAREDTVEVTAPAPILQTESATVGEVFSSDALASLPLDGRNPTRLSLLVPGAVTPNPISFGYVRNLGNGRPYVNGNREQTNNFLLDGVDMNESQENFVAYQPSPDALAEVSVETHNYTSDVGNVAGAVVSNVLKSGSNEVRGTLFEFYRDSSLDANSWDNNRTGTPRPERTRHVYGAAIGGPIARDRLFFFADFQGTRENAPGFESMSVAPAAWRTGDFSSVPVAIVDPLTGEPFAGNRIPLERISPVARAILGDTAAYPLPQREGDVLDGNYVGSAESRLRARQGDVRLDWNASTADRVFARFSFAEYEAGSSERPIPLLLVGTQTAPFRNAALNWSRVFTPSVAGELTLGFNQIGIRTESRDWAGIGDANARYGIPGDQPIPGLSLISWGSGLTGVGNQAHDSETLDRTWQVNARASALRGRHALRAGGEFFRFSQRRSFSGNNGLLGAFQYSGAFTGFAFSDFLLDQVSGKGRGSLAEPWTHLHNRYALFVQDDFKARDDLTVNLGLRWSYMQPWVERDDRQSNFDLQSGQQVFAGGSSRESRALFRPFYGGFEPRLGVSFRVNDRSVLRAGYGISQFMEGTGSNLRLPQNPPFFYESNVAFDQTTGAGSLATGFRDLVPRDQPSGQVRAFEPEIRPQFTQQWNLFLEFLVTTSSSVNVGYVGHRATHLVTPLEGNQPLPGIGDPSTWAPLQERRPLFASAPLLGNVSTTGSRGRSDHHALHVSLRQRPWNGLEFLASYTLGKTLSNSIGYYGSGYTANEGHYWMNAYRPEWNYGPAFFDVRHNLVVSGGWEVAFAPKQGLGKALLAGWRIHAVAQVRSGVPVTVIDGRGSSLQSVRGGERPNCVGDPQPEHPTLERWLDISAFSQAAPGTWGNCGVGTARAPGFRNLDLSLAKRVPVGGRRVMEIRLDAFNATNTPSFAPPARNYADPTSFGQVTGTVSVPRTLELGLKFYF
jgi:hypothetical protein